MSTAPASVAAPAAFVATKPTLFDVPVSNNGARVRYVLYKKGLEATVDIVAPATIGGLKSETYLELNPQGKMPLLVLPNGLALPESQVIESYILDKYKGQGPDLIPSSTPEARAIAALATRILDVYICSIQGCMYKEMPVEQRKTQLAAINYQLDVLEKIFVGPFVAGNELSYADSALLPTFVFFNHILPRHYGWGSIFTGRPKLQTWWNAMSKDDCGSRIISEIENGLAAWEANDRWEKLGIKNQIASENTFDWTFGN